MEFKCKAPMIQCHNIDNKFRTNQYTNSKVQNGRVARTHACTHRAWWSRKPTL